MKSSMTSLINKMISLLPVPRSLPWCSRDLQVQDFSPVQDHSMTMRAVRYIQRCVINYLSAIHNRIASIAGLSVASNN